MISIRFTRIAAVALVLLAAGCGDDSVSPPGVASYTVTVDGLAPLAAGKGHYELWIAFAGSGSKRAPAEQAPLHGDLELISLGTFQVDGSGAPVELDGTPAQWALQVERNPQFAAEAWISIEPQGDADTIPSGLLLAGEFLGTVSRATSNLSAGYEAVFDLESDVELESLRGRYELATYSDNVSTNEEAGIYWRETGDPGLEVPELDGVKIIYEAWIEVLGSGAPISCGRFRRPDSLDSDGTGFGAGGSIPQVPCEEFLNGVVRTLNDGSYRTFVSIEPRNDNDAARPTQFVLFADTIETSTNTGDPVTMRNETASFPTARVVIDR